MYAAKAQCIDQCKKKNLPRKLRNPDPLVLQKFRTRVPYSYLHYTYYQVRISLIIVVILLFYIIIIIIVGELRGRC